MSDQNETLKRVPEGFNPLGSEMEAFALFYTAKVLNKKASCIMSVVDSKYVDKVATAEEREPGLNLALESSLKM